MVNKTLNNACLTCSHGKTCKFKDEIQKKINLLERQEEVTSSNYVFKINLEAHFTCPFYGAGQVMRYVPHTNCGYSDSIQDETNPPGFEQV